MTQQPKRALISVSDKTKLIPFAKQLAEQHITLISTGNTARHLREAGITCLDVTQVTGSPELLDGRVKTLHPTLFAGILARRNKDDACLAEHAIEPIDIVVCNLYPFEQTIQNPAHTSEEAIEHIDIGGPSLIRAAAKNYQDVIVVSCITQYDNVAEQLQAGDVSLAVRKTLASAAFAHVAAYDAAISNYFNSDTDGFPRVYTLQMSNQKTLRYGENPHQNACYYAEHSKDVTIAGAQLLAGKALSFNNMADADSALECVKQFPESHPSCVIVKHCNPCGVARGDTLKSAYQLAYASDPESAFGGIIACNRPLDAETAACIIAQQFVDVIIAPEVLPAALAVLSAKPNIRVLSTGQWNATITPRSDIKRLTCGFLVQERDIGIIGVTDLQHVSHREASEQEFEDMVFAWEVAKFVRSNAIVIARHHQTLGIGGGQTSRATAGRLSIMQAKARGFDLNGAVLASDAFFPFRDGIDMAAEVGIRAIIQPGGSIKDQEIIDAANEHGIAMLFTGMRHFRH